MKLVSQTIGLTAKDGFHLKAFLCTPPLPRGGLVILQEIFGVAEQLKGVARYFAEQGYETIVPALYDRVSPDTVIPFDEIERGRETMQKLNLEQTLLDVEAAIARVDHGRGVSVLGYCWGGGIAMRAAGQCRLTGAIAYYGTALQKHLVNGARCPTLFHFGETDSHTPVEVIDAVCQALPDAEIHLYAAGHAFANDARPSYVEAAARLANQRSLAFLGRLHGG